MLKYSLFRMLKELSYSWRNLGDHSQLLFIKAKSPPEKFDKIFNQTPNKTGMKFASHFVVLFNKCKS